MAPKFKQPTLKRKRTPPPTATQTHQDNLCLHRLLLESWAWHPACPLPRTDEGPPTEFGGPDATEAQVAAHYRRVFQPFVADEAIAGLRKELEEELKANAALRVHLKHVSDLLDGKADVTLRIDAAQKVADRVGTRLREGAVVFLLRDDPRSHPPAALLSRPPAAAAERPAVVVAAFIKYVSRNVYDNVTLEAQHSPGPGFPFSAAHPAAFAAPALLGALDGAAAAPPPWFLAVCSVPVTAQREMAALEKVLRSDTLQLLARPSPLLRANGGTVHRFWPKEVRVHSVGRESSSPAKGAAISTLMALRFADSSSR